MGVHNGEEERVFTMIEADVQKQCMKAASECGALVWRNNTGAYKDGDRYIRYGLCKGSADIIGIYKGLFLAIEVKTKTGRASKAQNLFISAVNKRGGIGFVARSAEDVKKHLTSVRVYSNIET